MRRLNFHHLHYFWAVAKEGNLTRAAEALHVSQSALSTQIRVLEEQLGHPLFIRAGRSLQLTEAGRLVLDYAETIFALGSELQTILQSARQASQTLRIGAVATLSRNFQENLLRPFLGRDDLRLPFEPRRVHRFDIDHRAVRVEGDLLDLDIGQIDRHPTREPVP